MPNDVMTVGAARVNITPDVGTLLAGSLSPRTSTGVSSPLNASAVVIEAQGSRLAYVALDLISLERGYGGDEAVQLASQATGIPETHICFACSHTHTGPYTRKRQPQCLNADWMSALPGRIAEAVTQADANRVPARMSRARAFESRIQHNRRIRFKDGRHVNTWLLGRHINSDLQAVCSAGPVDPEIGMMAFDDLNGDLIALLYHFTLHANSDFGPEFSADYPAIVSDRIRTEFGDQVVPLFLPGCCADINPTFPRDHRTTGSHLADSMIPALKDRRPINTKVTLGAQKRLVRIPLRDLDLDQHERLEKCGWTTEQNEYFLNAQKNLRAEGVTDVETWVQAWHIGDTAFMALPGEVFVDWQVHTKGHSPFPWTFPIELSNDSLGYLITRDAWEGGGYEALISWGTFIDVAGVELMVDRGLEMLRQLYTKRQRALMQD
ncbi:MAG: hypothetical protein HN742_17215 [Lentisphaerae bacterium]|nr:hypothetical protein [Lentisphaerota bacterium]MBT4816552.1 hypothetical protein [Lentisphaerota bacterium]MBT5606902.1 hypothetical protein [Lentisphaerota bacterium]MBT7055522.1 hypothetical protein [Lentisphaerota bacterium]MBT7843621.1 hypothetical protein [Lentisphaerota bacterium]